MVDEATQEGRNGEDRRRALLALAVARRMPHERCPPPEDILAWHEELLTGEAAGVVQAHVARCEDCYALWTGILRTDAPEAPAQAPAAIPWWRRLFTGATGRRRLTPVLAGALAASLAMVAVVNLQQPGGPAPSPIPDYELTIQGRAVARGGTDPEPDGPVRLQSGNRFSVVLRPETALDGPVAAEALLLVDGRLEPLDAPPPQLLDYGVVAFEGRVGTDVLLPPGKSTLVFVTGRPPAMPSPGDVLSALDKATHHSAPDWRAWRIDLILE